jgi:sialate O-acetylesterase
MRGMLLEFQAVAVRIAGERWLDLSSNFFRFNWPADGLKFCMSAKLTPILVMCGAVLLGAGMPVGLNSADTISPVQPPFESENPEDPAPGGDGTLRLPGVFSDHMMLQHGVPAPVWGWAEDGETITVTFRDQHLTTQVRDSQWSVRLASLAPGGPDTLTVSGSTTLQFTNVLVGEVWICSGQSNMEWPMWQSYQPQDDIAAATDARIRLFTVPRRKAEAPVHDVESGWQIATPETVAGFSAVAYYFGRDLRKAREMPIGLIQATWGGSPAEAWTSLDTLESNPRYKSEILNASAGTWRKYERALAEFQRHKAELTAQEQDDPNLRPPRMPWKPAELYNGMISPLIPYAIRGVIWYQGESNASRAHQYRSLFPDLIRNWRRDWQQGDFPFLAVQLAPFRPIKELPGESDWAELREAQLLAAQTLPRVGLAVITDVGDEHDIHPTRKAPVGGRLALAARAIAHDEPIVYSGPVFKDLRIKGDRAILSFDHVGHGLESRGGSLKGFSLAGRDGKFVWALAEIEGDTVVVRSPNVARPVAVRYGWADYPVVNLWNKDGLPASPFRTDDFPLTTAPVRSTAAAPSQQ